MKKSRHTLSLGGLFIALLFLLLPHIGKSAWRLPADQSLCDTEIAGDLASSPDKNTEKGNKTCTLDLPGDTQPFILQQGPTLHLGGGEARQHTPATGNIQERHIKLFKASYKNLNIQQSTRQSRLHTDGYFFYMLCQMLM